MNDYNLENFKKFADLLDQSNNQWGKTFKGYADAWENDVNRHIEEVTNTAKWIEHMSKAYEKLNEIQLEIQRKKCEDYIRQVDNRNMDT